MTYARIALAAAVVLAGGVARAQLPASPRGRQLETAKSLTPVDIDLGDGAAGEPRVLRLRVWAARDYRDQTMRWQERFRRLVERVNQAVARWPGVRFEIVEVKPWDLVSGERPLDDVIAELERRDPGADVDWVVGLAAAVPVMPSSIHNIGMARTLGRHFVLRSLHDLAEYEAVREHLDLLGQGERDRLVGDRKRHKEVIVFLHEWAHTLGAIHAPGAQHVMNPFYGAGQRRFCDGNARILQLGLARRGAAGDEKARAAWHAELVQLVTRTASPDWDDKARDELLAVARGGREPRGPSPELRAALGRALEAQRAGKLDEAWRIVAPLARANEDVREVQGLACDVAYRHKGAPARIAAMEFTCRAAGRLLGEAWPVMMLADALLDAHREADARAELGRIKESFEAAHAGAERWAALAELYQKARLPTLADRAAARAGERKAAVVRAWTQMLRHRFALPEDAAALGAPPEREGEYLAAVDVGMAACAEGRLAAAAQLAAELERSFPRLPGAPLLRCRIALGERRLSAATSACAAALAIQEDAAAAHFSAANIDVVRGRARPAIAHLERARALDPDNRNTWRALADVYQRADRAALDALRAAYSEKFGEPLP